MGYSFNEMLIEIIKNSSEVLFTRDIIKIAVSMRYFFLIFVISSIVAITPLAYAETTIIIPVGSGNLGCNETNECYIPFTVTVGVGERVTWINNDSVLHTVTDGDLNVDFENVGNLFDSELIVGGQRFSNTFNDAGTFPYLCLLHPWMEGIVIVDETIQVISQPGQVTLSEPEFVAKPELAVEQEPMAAEPEPVTEEPKATESKCGPGTVLKDGECIAEQTSGGGCLIATATFGSELAPQVQFLRELRDDTVMSTSSGVSFMTGFNAIYYSFSPAIADLERQSPIFKETVKIAITPLLSSLSLLSFADIDSESEMLGYGIGVILLNIGMYFVAPAILIYSIKKRFNR